MGESGNSTIRQFTNGGIDGVNEFQRNGLVAVGQCGQRPAKEILRYDARCAVWCCGKGFEQGDFLWICFLRCVFGRYKRLARASALQTRTSIFSASQPACFSLVCCM